MSDYYYYRGKQIPLVRQNQSFLSFGNYKNVKIKTFGFYSYLNEKQLYSLKTNGSTLIDMPPEMLETQLVEVQGAKVFPVYTYEGKKQSGNVELLFNGDYFVKLNVAEKYFDLEALAKKYNSTILETIDKENRVYLLRFQGAFKDFLSAINHLYENNKKAIAYAHPDFHNPLKPESETPVTNNTHLSFQEWALKLMGIMSTWDNISAKALEQKPVKVAVLDEGIHKDHPDLGTDKVIYLNNQFSSSSPRNKANGHGTAVAGIISAVNNDKFIVGVAYKASLGDFRISYTDDIGQRISSTNKIVKGLKKAIEWKADVMNLSWSHPYADVIEDKIIDALNKKIIVCCAAGNYQMGESTSVRFPAQMASKHPVIAVGACDRNGNIINYNGTTGFGSCRGAEITLLAPGIEIATLSMVAAQFITDFKGTSASTAFVSGIAALLRSIKPQITPGEMQSLLSPSIGGPFQTINALDALTIIS